MAEGSTGRLLKAWIVCGAVAVSVPVYIGVAWFLARPAQTPSSTPGPPYLPWVVAACAIAALAAAGPLERVVARAGRGDPEAPLRGVLAGFALREAAAVAGLVASLITGEPMWALGLGALTLLAMGAAWPTPGRLARLAGGSDTPIEP